MEKWDILDGDGNSTGHVAVRGKTQLKAGEYHLVVHVWVVDENGRFLIQKRSDDKKLMPGEWAAIGGSAILGESSYLAANRELIEEMGIFAPRRLFKNMGRIKRRNAFVDVWFVKSNVRADELVLQASEVACAKWVTKNEFADMIKNGDFHNYGAEYFDSVFKFAEEYLYEFKS